MIDKWNKEKDWPFGGYMNPCRCGCGEYFTGPKRAPRSWLCMTNAEREDHLKSVRGPFE